jgi:hypothetical protein
MYIILCLSIKLFNIIKGINIAKINKNKQNIPQHLFSSTIVIGD